MFIQSIATPVGQLQAIWTDSGLLRSCQFADADLGPVDRGYDISSVGGVDTQAALLVTHQQFLAECLSEYFRTGRLAWDLARLDWQGITPFHRQVLERCAQIPAGQTSTYGELAAEAGRPRAARAVGSAMARNRWPLIIPCHRVVGSSGRLTGYSGTGGIETKHRLLGLEAGELVA